MKSDALRLAGFYWYVSEYPDTPIEICCVEKHYYTDVDGDMRVWYEVFGTKDECGSHHLNYLGDFYGPLIPPNITAHGGQ